MQVIIFGASPIGLKLAKRLSLENEEVVLVDIEADKKAAEASLDVVTVNGLIIDLGIMEEAGIAGADVVCAVSDNEKMNIMVCQIAKGKFHCKKIIAAVFNSIEYRIYEDMGIVPISGLDLTVETVFKEINDEFTMEKGIEATEYYKLFGREHCFKLYNVDKSLIGNKVKNIAESAGGNIFALVREGDMIHDCRELKIQAGDRLIVSQIID